LPGQVIARHASLLMNLMSVSKTVLSLAVTLAGALLHARASWAVSARWCVAEGACKLWGDLCVFSGAAPKPPAVWSRSFRIAAQGLRPRAGQRGRRRAHGGRLRGGGQPGGRRPRLPERARRAHCRVQGARPGRPPQPMPGCTPHPRHSRHASCMLLQTPRALRRPSSRAAAHRARHQRGGAARGAGQGLPAAPALSPPGAVGGRRPARARVRGRGRRCAACRAARAGGRLPLRPQVRRILRRRMSECARLHQRLLLVDCSSPNKRPRCVSCAAPLVCQRPPAVTA